MGGEGGGGGGRNRGKSGEMGGPVEGAEGGMNEGKRVGFFFFKQKTAYEIHQC